MEIKKVSIHLRSVIDGQESHTDYEGEYGFKDGSHHIVYTDYAGNGVTKTGIEATGDRMLLHRTGHIRGDMLFDPRMETGVSYEAFSLTNHFRLKTRIYRLTKTDKHLRIYTVYSLNDRSGAPEIRGVQEMIVSME